MQNAPETEKREGLHSVVIRMPVSLHVQLKEKADREERSVTAHVRHLISQDVAA